MTQVSINGNTYSDDGTTSKDMRHGGHQTHFLPMVQDVATVAGTIAVQSAAAIAAIAAFDGNWGHLNTTNLATVEVGPGQAYPTLWDAWVAVKQWTLRQNIRIHLADGVHQMNVIWLSGHPQAQMISIEGNLANPANCVIEFTPDSNHYSHGIHFFHVSGISFSGVTLRGSQTAAHWTYRGIYVGEGAVVSMQSGTVILDQCRVEVCAGGTLFAPNLRIQGVYDWAVATWGGGKAYLSGLTLVGAGKTATVTRPDGATVGSHGTRCIDNGLLDVSAGSISDVVTGVAADLGANVAAFGTTVTRVRDHGFVAVNGGRVTAGAQTVATGAKVIGCDNVAYAAYTGGLLLVEYSTADTAPTGYNTDTCGLIQANNSTVKNCSTIGYKAYAGGQIEANGTQARAVNTPTLYNPSASGVPGNQNGMVRFS